MIDGARAKSLVGVFLAGAAIAAPAPAAEAQQTPEYSGFVEGSVYVAGETAGVGGARVWLLYDDSQVGSSPLPCDENQQPVELVAEPEIGASETRPLPRAIGAACLPEGQQGQATETGALAGAYRFELPWSESTVNLRVQVVPPTPGLAFPSTTVPPSGGRAETGSAAPDERPDPTGPTDYWLEVRAGSQPLELSNNHLPLDRLESLLFVEKTAARATVTRGEAIAYSLTVTNLSGRDIRAVGGVAGGLTVRNLVPVGMRYVRGTSRAQRVVSGPGGEQRRLCPRVGEDLVDCPSESREPASLPAGQPDAAVGRLLDYGPFDLPAGQTLELRYTLVTAPDARPGEKVSASMAMLDSVLVGEASETVRVVEDLLFDLGTLYGRVFCEGDGGRGRGLPGVRVYADFGHYAVTDGAGRWHIHRVPPGLRLLKLDERTLPPGSVSTRPVSRPLYVTPGLDTVVDWEIDCALEEVSPEISTARVRLETNGALLSDEPEEQTREAIPDDEHQPHDGDAEGTEEDETDEEPRRRRDDEAPPVEAGRRAYAIRLSLPVDASVIPRVHVRGSKIEMPLLATQVVADSPVIQLSSGGSLAQPVGFEISAHGEIARWRLEAGPKDRLDHVIAAGEGAPPRRVEWDGVELDAGLAPVFYRLVVRDALGNEGRSSQGELRLAPPPVTEVHHDLVDGGELTPAASDILRDVARALLSGEGGRIEIESHTDSSGGAEVALERSRSSARALARALEEMGVPSSHIEALGRGAEMPLVPNVTQRNRARNNRVVLSVYPPPPPPPGQRRIEPRVSVEGEEAVRGPEGDWSVDLEELPGLLSVEILTEDGRRASYRLPMGLSPWRTPLDAEGTLPRTPREPPEQEAGAGGGFETSPSGRAGSVVGLPPEGSVVRSRTLGLTGYTDPGAEVWINEEPIRLELDGSFATVAELPRGPSTLTVRIRDASGEEATIERDFISEPDGVFVLAMADSHVGMRGAELSGVTSRTQARIGRAYLHGRGVGYAKGEWRLDEGPFRDLSLTLHLDTAREPTESYFADLARPDRHYPTYGDSAIEVQDAAARGPLFVSARADGNELRVGSFQTDPGEGGVFRYRRTFDGARLRIDQPVLEGAAVTRGELFVGADPAEVRPGHAVMQGTGGSLYFLRHRDIIEGSESLRIVVRDRDTGVELASRPLVRHVDYVIRPREGQVMLGSPLPSVVEADWMAGFNLAGTLDGNPTFLVADYEHRSQLGDGGVAFGGYLTETLFDWITLGGGAVLQDEGFGAGDYGLWGLMAELRPLPNTFLRGELAMSRGADAGGFYSADGGMSFFALQPACEPAQEGASGCPGGGAAIELGAGATLGDLIGAEEDIARAGLHAHLQDTGFYGSQLLLDQGRRIVGGRLSWDVTERDILSLRADRVSSRVPLGSLGGDLDSGRRIVRSYTGLRYQRSEERWRAALELASGAVRDDAVEDDGQLWTHMLAAGGEYDATERLALVLEQGLVLGGDGRSLSSTDASRAGLDPQLADASDLVSWNDRFTTTFGGRWRLTEGLRLSALGRARWNGEHSALVGLQTRVSEGANVHVRHGLTRLTGGGWRSQSVIGGEQEVSPGLRSYGEYQLEGGVSGASGRAVLGMSNRFSPAEGLTLGLAYERVQVLGDPGLGPLVPGATIDPATGRVSTRGRFDGLPPFDSVGVNPAGAYYPGAVSRDAVSTSVEYLRDPIETSVRLELRADDADDELAGVLPGVADRLQALAAADLAWTWSRDLSAIGRLRYADTLNRTRKELGLDEREAQWVELTAGVALRPERSDWFTLLAKYTRLVDQRPLALGAAGGDRHSSHVLSIAPVLRTPWRLTLSEKIAYKHTKAAIGVDEPEALGPPPALAHTLLWINRLDWHVLSRFDLTGEYRLLWVGRDDAAERAAGGRAVSGATERGFVAEVAWRVAEHLRLGAGYNFARFGDDELSRLDTDESGPFLRVTGIY